MYLMLLLSYEIEIGALDSGHGGEKKKKKANRIELLPWHGKCKQSWCQVPEESKFQVGLLLCEFPHHMPGHTSDSWCCPLRTERAQTDDPYSEILDLKSHLPAHIRNLDQVCISCANLITAGKEAASQMKRR